MQKMTVSILLMLLMTLGLPSCGIYSFTGASVSPDLKSYKIENFDNLSSLVLPSLSQTLIEELKDRISSRTNLRLSNEEGDIEFEGAIVETEVAPIASGGNDTAFQNRLTVSIRVDYVNNVDDDSWSTSFKRFADFDKDLNLNEVEDQLIEEIVDQLAEDVFNKALVNW